MSRSSRPLKVFVVAGELSGDLLGAGLLRELKRRYPEASFRGIGGPRMISAGLQSLAPLERLSVMGLVEVLKHLPGLVKLRRMLRQAALDWRADVMIGIDAPDFNLGLEGQLREAGIATVHYVSPSVWAWRQGRIKGIRRSVDLMLTFLPFEADFYREHGVPVRFVGHPLADELPLDNDAASARRALGIEHQGPLLAMLPGSRHNEVKLMLPVYLEALALLRQRLPKLRAVLPAASAARRAEIEALLDEPAREAISLIDGDASLAMVAADAVLLTSGTSALEAMLCHRPMVVAYRMAPVTHWIAQRVVKTEWISLPNLIAGETLVPELIQQQANPARIAALLEPLLSDAQTALRERFARMHAELAIGASVSAAEAVMTLVEEGPEAKACEPEADQ